MSSPFHIFSWQQPFLPALKQATDLWSDGRPGDAVIIVPHNRPWRYLVDIYAAAGTTGLLPKVLSLPLRKGLSRNDKDNVIEQYLSDDPDSDLFDYVQLYLNEEIQAEGLVRNLPSFERFLEVAALSNSEMLNYENISKDVGVSRSAVISWFQILYDTLIAFEVPAYTKTKKRKAYASSKFYMFDLGVIRHLLGFEKIEAGSTEYGKFFETYIAMEMRAYIGYRSRPKLNITPLGYWRSLSGFEVDYILMEKVAIETKTTHRHTARDLKGLKALKEEGLFSRYILVCNEDYAHTAEDGIEIVPWRQFLDELWAGKII